MVQLRFRSRGDPFSLAFTDSHSLDTIFIPREAVENAAIFFHGEFGLPPEDAYKAASIFLEEIYDHVLAHEATHLALGHLAKKEKLPVDITMEGLHNPIYEEVEETRINKAISKALNVVLKRRRK